MCRPHSYLEWMKRDRNGPLMPYPCGNLTDYIRGWDPISDETAGLSTTTFYSFMREFSPIFSSNSPIR